MYDAVREWPAMKGQETEGHGNSVKAQINETFI